MTNPRDTWSAAKHDEIINRLMMQIGMPNSRSLYQAFKQFANELHYMDLGASATAPQPTTLDAVGEPVAWRVLITKNTKTYNEYTERLPFEPLEGSGVVVRREPEPLYTHPPKSPNMIELLKLAYDNMFDGEAREQVRRKLFE